jgi:Survival motor neuron (SMN) interacting protein 1 (SIP1)
MIPSAADWRAWKRRLESTEPETAQLAAMQKDTVVRLLRIMVAKFLKGGGKTLPRRTSSWIWGLLARLPDIGVLGSEEVGVVRDLGKRAVLVGVGLRGINTQGLDDQVDEGAIEEEEIVDVELQAEEVGTDEAESEDPPIIGQALASPDQARRLSSSSAKAQAAIPLKPDTDLSTDALEAARDNLLARLQDSDSEQQQLLSERQEARLWNIETETAKEEIQEQEYEEEGKVEDKADAGDIDETQNTRATIDMILTIAGELYGQRDLLEFREVWE